MTVQATVTALDADALLAAAGAAAAHLTELGTLQARVLLAEERSGGALDGGVALSARTGGAHPGRVGFVAGVDAATALAGQGGGAEIWEALMTSVVDSLAERVGSLDVTDVEVLDPTGGPGPALDPAALSVGLTRGEELVAAVGFVAEQAPEEAPAPAAGVFKALVAEDNVAAEVRRMHLLRDVEMGVSVELGRTRMAVRDLLGLTPGAIIELDKAAGAPVDVLVNGTLMAHGEVVVIDEEFAVRISEIVTPDSDSRPGI